MKNTNNFQYYNFVNKKNYTNIVILIMEVLLYCLYTDLKNNVLQLFLLNYNKKYFITVMGI